MTAKRISVRRRRDASMPLRLLLVALAASALSGCYTASDKVTIPNDYRKRHPIALREGDRMVEVLIGSHRGALTPDQRAEVLSFARGWARESTGGVAIEVPHGTSNAFASSEAAREIQSIFAAAGIPANVIAMRAYAPETPHKLSFVRMRYSKIMADAGPCGLWPHDLGPSTDPAYNENRPYWNLGCANQRNLAAMVAHPADLVQPRNETPAWTPRRTTVLEKYRAGQSPETIYPRQNVGAVSNVGR